MNLARKEVVFKVRLPESAETPRVLGGSGRITTDKSASVPESCPKLVYVTRANVRVGRYTTGCVTWPNPGLIRVDRSTCDSANCPMIVDVANSQAILRITAGLPGSNQPIEFLQFADESTKPNEVQIREMLSQVSVQKSLQLYELDLHYSSASGATPDPARFPRNTMVEVALPYCLHLPNGLSLFVSVTGATGGAVVILQKFWTTAAAGSATADLFTADRVTYAAPVTFNTPNFPEAPELGPRLACSGTNIELDRDTSGQFRYSKLKIFFDTQHQQLDAKSKSAMAAVRGPGAEDRKPDH